MKRYALMVLMLASAAALFAGGNSESAVDEAPAWGRGSYLGVEGEEVTLTGTLSVVDGHIVLTADGETYLLGAPRAGWYVDEIEEGMVVTVEGFIPNEITGPVTDVDVDAHMSVISVTRDGEALDLGIGAPGFAGRGPAGDFAGRGPASDVAGTGRGLDDDQVPYGYGRSLDDDDAPLGPPSDAPGRGGRGAGRRGRV